MDTTPIPPLAPAAPLWVRRPGVLVRAALVIAGLVFVGQVVAVVVHGAGAATMLSVLFAGVGVVVAWWWPWPGLVLTSAASFAVIAAGRDPLSVWMTAVLVLFSATLRGVRPVYCTGLVAAALLASFMSVGEFRGGAFAAATALFSAIAGGATGAALRSHRVQWHALAAVAEAEAERRVAEERLRIARDLHDVVGHQVAMLSVHLGVAEVGLPSDAEQARAALVAARTSGRTVVTETQRILALLRRDEVRTPVPSLGAIDDLVASFVAIGLAVDAEVDLPNDVDAGVGVTLYRVLQEGLTNAQRHGAGSASVRLAGDDRRLRLVLENPVGAARQPGGGLGLVGMRERVAAIGGRLRVDDHAGCFRLLVELDLRAATP